MRRGLPAARFPAKHPLHGVAPRNTASPLPDSALDSTLSRHGVRCESIHRRTIMNRFVSIAGAATVFGIVGAYSVHAAPSAQLDCKLTFSLSTWSAIYKHSEGSGIVSCEDGRSMRVKIAAKGV